MVKRGRKGLGPEQYHALAEERGIIWLGPPVNNSLKHTGWKCKRHGHEWQTTYSSLNSGSRCPECAVLYKAPKKRSQLLAQDYHELAEQRGFVWLGPEVNNTSIPTGWQCSEGHEWNAIYSDIRRGRGCPYCAGTFKVTLEDYHNLAKVRSFIWLGPEVQNSLKKTVWECAHGHRWEACFSSIQNGSGCPVCRGRKPKEITLLKDLVLVSIES